MDHPPTAHLRKNPDGVARDEMPLIRRIQYQRGKFELGRYSIFSWPRRWNRTLAVRRPAWRHRFGPNENHVDRRHEGKWHAVRSRHNFACSATASLGASGV